jgi:hypothetical protein
MYAGIGERVPQGLKPDEAVGLIVTAEAVTYRPCLATLTKRPYLATVS